MKILATALLSLILVSGASAKELAGVALPDTAVVTGKTVKLNGLGLRTKLFFKIYVAGLYLENPTSNASVAISSEETKRVVMHFLYKKVSRSQLLEAWNDGFEENSPAEVPKLKKEIAEFLSWMGDINAGSEIVLTYEPGAGTTVDFAGVRKGAIPGPDFMRALWSVWLGEHPPTGDLRSGMLGARG
jgi:hypothetical protein